MRFRRYEQPSVRYVGRSLLDSVRFGRYSYTLGPGLGWTLPAPIERVKKIDVENIRTIDLGSSNADDLMLTGDQNMIEVNAVVHYAMTRPDDFLFRQLDADTTVRTAAESALQTTVSTAPLDDVLTTGRQALEELIEIPPDVCRKTVAQYEKHDAGRGSADWPAYLRMLDRIDPSYRT